MSMWHYLQEMVLTIGQLSRRISGAKKHVYFNVYLALAHLIINATDVLAQPTASCPKYVDEGADLDCTCNAPRPNMADTNITWPRYSNTPRLQIKRVSRRDNGRQYTCQMVSNKITSTTVYTLRVAYGPSDDTVRIEGPNVFTTNGSQTLVLPCVADEVNPIPLITWLFDPCDHGVQRDNCTFKPDPLKHDGVEIKCRAMNPYTTKSAAGIASYVLHLKYPPLDAPVIHGHGKGEIHKAGDKLTCTVIGGKPMVSDVIFTCNNPAHTDEPDVTENSSISSSITVSSCEPVDYETVCACSTVWKPNPSLYTRMASVSFAVRRCDNDTATILLGTGSSKGGHYSLFGMTVEIVIVSALAVCVVVIIGLILMRCGVTKFIKTLKRRRRREDRLHAQAFPVPVTDESADVNAQPQELVALRETDEDSSTALVLRPQHSVQQYDSSDELTRTEPSRQSVAVPPSPMENRVLQNQVTVSRMRTTQQTLSQTVSGVPVNTLTRHVREIHHEQQVVMQPVHEDDSGTSSKTYKWPKPVKHKSHVMDTIEAFERTSRRKKDTRKKRPYGSDVESEDHYHRGYRRGKDRRRARFTESESDTDEDTE